MLRQTILLALVMMTTAPMAHAGIYQPGEKFEPLFTNNFEAFYRETLEPLQRLQTSFQIETPWQPEKEKAKTKEEKKQAKSHKIWKNTFFRERSLLAMKLVRNRDLAEFEDLTDDELLALSAYSIRLGGANVQKAIDLLEDRVSRPNRRNYLLVSNLATAHFIQGNYPVAKRYLNDIVGAGAAWPENWEDLSIPEKDKLHSLLYWDKTQFEWHRHVEQYLLKLATLRDFEAQRAGRKLRHSVDALFPLENPLFPRLEKAVKYVGESGKFEPGKMAEAERKKLPENAYAVLNQLLFWLPTDYRLVWQFAELMNAVGDPATPQGFPAGAYNLMDDLVYNKKVRGYNDLNEHRTILLSYIKEQKKKAKNQTKEMPVGIPKMQPDEDKKVEKKEDQKTWQPTPWQLLGIGFGTGMLVAIFGHWQLRELFRRRKRPQPTPTLQVPKEPTSKQEDSFS